MESLRQQVFFRQMEWCHLWGSPVIMELTGWLKPWAEEVAKDWELRARGWAHRWQRLSLSSSPCSKPSKSKYTVLSLSLISLSPFEFSLLPPLSLPLPLSVFLSSAHIFLFTYHPIMCLPTMWKGLSLKSIACHTTPVVWAKGKAVGMWIQ